MTKGSPTQIHAGGIWALPVRGGGSQPLPGWFGATFLGKNLLDFGGGLDPCPDGLGHFFGDEVPQSARLSAGRGVQKPFGQCPNAPSMNFRGASLNVCRDMI